MLIQTEKTMLVYGAELVNTAKAGDVFLLEGNLGAGKTTLVRGFLRGLGFEGKVKSPTYTLVESYEAGSHTIHHFDLYRLSVIDQLHEIGFEEYLSDGGICLIEWPALAESLIKNAKRIQIDFCDEGRLVTLSLV